MQNPAPTSERRMADVNELRAAYDRFLEVIRERRFAEPPAGEWSAERVLAHVVVGDRLLAEAAAEVLAGRVTSFDNRASQSVPYLDAIVEAAGDWDGLVEAVRRGGLELIALAERLTEEQAATVVPATVHSGGEIMLDGPTPVGRLLQAPAAVHLAGHIQQLEALRRES